MALRLLPVLLPALPSAGSDSGSDAVARPVERHVGVWTAAPTSVPGTSQQPDGPLAGNGDFGFVIGGKDTVCTLPAPPPLLRLKSDFKTFSDRLDCL